MKTAFFLFALVLSVGLCSAQVSPQENSKLHYRIIGFKFAGKPDQTYTLQIAKGAWTTDSDFKKSVIYETRVKGTRVIAEVPSFGADYTWRVLPGKGLSENVELHHFSTMFNPLVDTNRFRFRIIQHAEKYQDAYVIVDATKVIYDMMGNPVWFLPEATGVKLDDGVRDIKLSVASTLTMLQENERCFEIDYNANILWATPKKATVSSEPVEHFHHEFTRLKNGHYMTLGSEIADAERSILNGPNDITVYFPRDAKKPDPRLSHTMVPFGTVIEYDKTGKVVWYWLSSNYFRKSDVFNHVGKRGNLEIGPHINSFYFNEQNKTVYLSCRDISRILKVSYPTGKVLAAYGETFAKGQPEMGNGLFCKQHSVSISSDGLLRLYNNNSCYDTTFPTILTMREPTAPNNKLAKAWEYSAKIEGEPGPAQINYQFTLGGTVTELPDKSIFACLGTLYCKLFIVTPDKKELWSGIPEAWDKSRKMWTKMLVYKASIIPSKKQFEDFIWAQKPLKNN
jgi:hypothetical protein